MKKLPVVLVTGFLGAGKTTLMRRLIQDGHERGLKLCVIVNEFGMADVDGHILKEADAELLASITGGCACCSGQDDFHDTVLEIALRPTEQKPDVIVVEASGMADPGLMLEVLTSPELLPRVQVSSIVCVADATRPAEYAMRDFGVAALLKNQLQLADCIVLNKTDLASPEIQDALRTQFQKLNPNAQLVPAIEAQFDYSLIWNPTRESTPTQNSKLKTQTSPHVAHTVFCPLPHPVERTRLEAALSGLPSQVWRAKGFVRVRGEAGVLLVQYTGGGESVGRWRLAPFHLPFGMEEPATGLVFIGAGLDEKELLKEFLGRDQLLAFV